MQGYLSHLIVNKSNHHQPQGKHHHHRHHGVPSNDNKRDDKNLQLLENSMATLTLTLGLPSQDSISDMSSSTIAGFDEEDSIKNNTLLLCTPNTRWESQPDQQRLASSRWDSMPQHTLSALSASPFKQVEGVMRKPQRRRQHHDDNSTKRIHSHNKKARLETTEIVGSKTSLLNNKGNRIEPSTLLDLDGPPPQVRRESFNCRRPKRRSSIGR